MTVKLERIWFYAGLTSLISVIGILIVFSDRGFDFTDEGLYALLSNPNQENRISIINYDIIFKYLYQYFGITFNLIELRILRLILVLLGSFYLLTPIYQLNKERIKKVISPRLFVIIGLLLGFWSYAPLFLQTPNYNTFHFLGIQLFIGSLLFFHTILISNQIIRTLLFSSICFLGFLFCWLSKVSGIPVLVIILILQYFIKSNKSFVWHVLFLLVFVIYFTTFLSFHTLMYKNIIQNVIYALFKKTSSHSLDSQFKNITLNFILTLSAFLTGIFYRVKLHYVKRKTILYLLSLLLIIAMIFVYFDFNNSKITNYSQPDFFLKYLIIRISILLVLLLAFFTGVSFDSKLFNRKLIPILILNLGIVAYVIGTNHILLLQSISSIQFLILSWFFLESRRIQKNIVLSFIPITLIIFFCFIFIDNIPSRQSKLINATHKYYYGKKKYEYIFLDKESFLIQSKIKSIIKKDSINFILGYDRLPGFIYLSGMSYTSPGSYLWGDEDIDMYFRKKFTYPNSLQLILNGKKSKEIMFPYLENYTILLNDSIKVNLPHRYQEASQFYIYTCIRKN